MITRAVAFVEPNGRLTPAAWQELTRMQNPPGPYEDNAAAVAAGLAVGMIYYTATGEIRVVV
jgi:hypothetical protein